MPSVAVSVCLHCGYPVADPEFIRDEGVMRAVVLVCRRCGEASLLSWPHE
jgi:ribosomal protein L37E